MDELFDGGAPKNISVMSLLFDTELPSVPSVKLLGNLGTGKSFSFKKLCKSLTYSSRDPKDHLLADSVRMELSSDLLLKAYMILV